MRRVFPSVKGKVCLVTGGGGSIGSELVRQLYAYGAEKIVIADIYENGAYEVSSETGGNVVVEIASVRDRCKMDFVMSQYRPDIIFHAAAHKHVPFMERNPEEAVKNNILGTDIMTELAGKYRTDNFVLISTDKAVEPVSVMGASKRVCEMLVYEKALVSDHTCFTTVRFGNVINSNGSVIPLFKRQIRTGIVTVTHRDVTRYFMTIPQAVELVLCSLELAENCGIFVLDMGESVKILDLAEQLIREAGMEPYKDVKIEFTGLRKGDKLHEKLFYSHEKPQKTIYKNIMRADGSGMDNLSDELKELYAMADKNDKDGVRSLIMKMTEGE